MSHKIMNQTTASMAIILTVVATLYLTIPWRQLVIANMAKITPKQVETFTDIEDDDDFDGVETEASAFVDEEYPPFAKKVNPCQNLGTRRRCAQSWACSSCPARWNKVASSA